MAREWCSCGAAIRGRRKHILEWRRDHLHTSGEPEQEPPMDGSHAQVELAGVPDLTVWNEHGPVRPNVIGFQVIARDGQQVVPEPRPFRMTPASEAGRPKARPRS
jgi:hypothetical protein